MQVEVDPDETVAQLWEACDNWSERASMLQSLADSGFAAQSRLSLDNAAVAVDSGSLAVTRYVQERLWNAARALRALHRQVFETDPARFQLDATTMYPLMRAVVEDCTTVSWLQQPVERRERLTRVFRVMATDSAFFTENYRLLGRAAGAVGAVAAEDGAALADHMTAERASARAQLERLAGEVGLDVAEAVRSVSTRAPVTAVYGGESVELVTWKLLSDLSHFSFLMLRHLAESRIPGSGTPLLHVTLLSFARTTNRVCDDAVAYINSAAMSGE